MEVLKKKLQKEQKWHNILLIIAGYTLEMENV
jgi:hypothetical protein